MKRAKKTKKRKLKKHRKTYKKNYTGGRLLPWVGIPNINQPTGFGWILNRCY